MGGLTIPKFTKFNLPFLGSQKLTIGLDIGSHAIKACQLTPVGDQYKLVSLGSARLPPNCVEDGVMQEPETVGQIISTLLKNLKLKGNKVAISISGYSVIVKKISLMAMEESELASHIQAEAEQYIPFDIDEVFIDFQDLKTNTEEDERTDVILVAAKKDVVNGYLEMLSAVGLETVIVDVDAFALENAYGANFGGETENVGLVDIGASKMNINVVAKGASVLVRDVVMGGRILTDTIQSHFNISPEEAEELKTGRLDPGDKMQELEDIFVNTCNQWITEVKRALDFYYSNYPDETIDKIVLSGGGAKIKGLAKLFAEETGIKTEIFNPFAKAEGDPDKIDPGYLKNVGPEMALSTGLATRSTNI
ncbi:MAG: type IV pilus assembly protein PilM [Desulfurivibrionaceae bacterium]|nr:type IV pilus assembly protein PilM [Desulfobulbales bacterium]MDT8335594.1 type IV pilus assembly protein PilM [Desulfurivibrionaceae bacterium]